MTQATAALKARREAARPERDQFATLIDECYDYAIPFRRSASQDPARGGTAVAKGDKRIDKVFDQTAMEAAFRGAGRLQQDLWPTGQQNFMLKPGPLVPQDASDGLAKPLEQISTVCGAMLLDGEFDQALGELCLDLQAGTAAMLILKGDSHRLARFVCCPISEIMLEAGPYGDVTAIFWSRSWTLQALNDAFPKAKWPEDLATKLKDKPQEEILIHQDTVWDPKRRRWALTTWSEKWKDGEEPIAESRMRACPWLTPRYYRVPGEVYGRGPIMVAMPGIKTVNTAAKISLQAAAIAMLGIYTAVDDGVFSPDVSPIAPGAFWKVARNGGNLGPTVSRFPDPNIELSNLVLNDLRMGIKSAMNDQQLPPDSAAVRSASEIMERVKRLASDHMGAYGRLVAEIVVPLIRRLIEIAYDHRLIADAPNLDQLLVQVQIASPLAYAREAERIQKNVQAVEMATMTLGPQGRGRVIKVEDTMIEAFRAMGVPERLIPTLEERQQMADAEAAMAAASMAAEAAPAIAEAEAAEAADPAAQPTPEMMV